MSGMDQKGTIIGTVTDKSKKPIEEAMIDMIKTPTTGPKRDIMPVTDEKGKYKLAGLSPGLYTLKFSFPGYKPATKKDVKVEASKTVTLDVVLEKA